MHVQRSLSGAVADAGLGRVDDDAEAVATDSALGTHLSFDIR